MAQMTEKELLRIEEIEKRIKNGVNIRKKTQEELTRSVSLLNSKQADSALTVREMLSQQKTSLESYIQSQQSKLLGATSPPRPALRKIRHKH